jgi:hypothetical protein
MPVPRLTSLLRGIVFFGNLLAAAPVLAANVYVYPPIATPTTTTVVSGRTYFGAVGQALAVPDYDVSGLISAGWTFNSVISPETYPTNPNAVSFGQVKVTTTGTPVQLPVIVGVNGFVVRSKTSNTGVGGYDCAGPNGVTTTSDGTGNGACEPPGGAWSFGVTQAGAVYVNGAAGDVFFVYGN